jgi:transcriptional regulator GlxA family with amidase domain
VQSFDLTGLLEVFTGAGSGYEVHTAAVGGRPVRTSSGLTITPDAELSEPDILVVRRSGHSFDCCCAGGVAAAECAASGARHVSVYRAFLLAEAGLLDGRRVTTHWAWCESLARRFPNVLVDPEPIFIRDGQFATSAGVTAGIDLALAQHPARRPGSAARTVARTAVLDRRAPG